MITIRYEISYEAVKQEFIENGVYYSGDNYGRWLEISAKPEELSKDDRKLIWENCKDSGDGDFIYEDSYINMVCKSIDDFLDAIRD